MHCTQSNVLRLQKNSHVFLREFIFNDVVKFIFNNIVAEMTTKGDLRMNEIKVEDIKIGGA